MVPLYSRQPGSIRANSNEIGAVGGQGARTGLTVSATSSGRVARGGAVMTELRTQGSCLSAAYAVLRAGKELSRALPSRADNLRLAVLWLRRVVRIASVDCCQGKLSWWDGSRPSSPSPMYHSTAPARMTRGWPVRHAGDLRNLSHKPLFSYRGI
jgi:hypothetical protein